MVLAALKRHRTAALIALWSVVVLGALFALSLTSQNSAQFSRLQPWILLFSLMGVLVFAMLLARKILQLVRDYRAHVPGSRLTARTVFVFGLLVIMPLLTVYLFSLEFLNRSVDSWFRVEVRQGLNDALVLSRSALDLRLREHAARTEEFAQQLSGMSEIESIIALDDERRASGAVELVLYGDRDRIIAASARDTLVTLPAGASAELVRQVSDGRTFVALEPVAEDQYLMRTAAPVPASRDARFVLAVYEVPRQLAALADAVQRSYSQYGDLAALREPLKYSFRLTLTLVLLVTMLAAIYGAIFFAQRLFRPVQDLMEGTRAVAKGDLGMRLPLSSRDEMGFLVQSFNDMTKRLRRAREETERSRQDAERERKRLEIILTRLSSGVIAFDAGLNLRIANDSASRILGLDLGEFAGQPLSDAAERSDRMRLFLAAIRGQFALGRNEWREQLDLQSDAGAQVLMCACVPLPDINDGDTAADPDRRSGHIVVFDEITALLQAQREAAWGEVARRLAHEIKNPLTPIQLSAERMRRRFLGSMSPEDADVLERSTHTIVQQVETMKRMVNAFSEYARSPAMQLVTFDLNALVSEVADLYRAQDPAIEIRTRLEPTLAEIQADRGRVRQILNNLLTNAIEALDQLDSASIEVTTSVASEQPDSALITVTDNGAGFQRELLGRIFDPYVTTKPRGTGLGLAIVRKIVEEHGGRIEADNQAEGGARVRVTLPLVERTRPGSRELRSETRKEWA